MKRYFVIVCVFFFSGCTGIDIDTSIREYNAAAGQIQLGDSKDKVLSILMPTQKHLSAHARKSPEQYIKDGVKIEIYYFRSLRQPDGLTTDDEFIPYVFNDGKLVSIGWIALGGPKTKGQVIPQTNVDVTVHDHHGF
jgi:hypothetical protein